MAESHEQQGGGLEWGYEIPNQAVERIRQNLSVIGQFDERKVLTGHVLERMLGDDAGVFGTAALWHSRQLMRPQEAAAHKEIFLNRVRWELEQPQTPQTLKDGLSALREKLGGLSWDKEDNVKTSRSLWDQMVHSKALSMYDANIDGIKDCVKEFRNFEDEARKRKLPR